MNTDRHEGDGISRIRLYVDYPHTSPDVLLLDSALVRISAGDLAELLAAYDLRETAQAEINALQERIIDERKAAYIAGTQSGWEAAKSAFERLSDRKAEQEPDAYDIDGNSTLRDFIKNLKSKIHEVTEENTSLKAKCWDMQEDRDRALAWREHDKLRAEDAEAEVERMTSFCLSVEDNLAKINAILEEVKPLVLGASFASERYPMAFRFFTEENHHFQSKDDI